MRVWMCLVILGCCSLSTLHCSSPPPCINSIGPGTIDPNGRPCDNNCDCNNQNYTGSCLLENGKGTCQSKSRIDCVNIGEQQRCELDRKEGCREGIQTCQDLGLNVKKWGDCKPIAKTNKEEGATLCSDGIDNDCDGKVDLTDEGCQCKPGDTQDCYTGKSGTQNKGQCKDGKQTCSTDFKWSKICVGEVLPDKEALDKLDNDCDGKVDEDLECNLGDIKDCGKVEGECKKGQQFCTSSNKWGPCVGEIKPERPQCDGKDNDCDGKLDHIDNPECECKSGDTGVCYTGSPPSTAGVGICSRGTRFCLPNGKWSQCQGQFTPEPKELCNQKDDNCDGTVDEGCDCLPGTSRGCGKDVGVCKKGQQTCSPDGKWGECFGSMTPGPKKCDGKDNDCDGQPDSDDKTLCECKSGDTGVCYSGAPSSTAGVGICSRGTRFCLPSGKWSPCQGQITPGKEECNLKDDDCDGVIDNNPNKKGINTLTRECYNSTTGCTRDPNSGAYTCKIPCKQGTQQCVNGNWLPCEKAVQPQTEECNGKDDDCDGQVDNVLASNTPLCHHQMGSCQGSRLPPNACQNGMWRSCNVIDYQRHSDAKSQGFSTIETCDRKDNNCDGQVDEDLLNCVTMLAGSHSYLGYKDSVGNSARFYEPTGLAFSKQGELFIADRLNNRIRKLDLCGTVSTIAGDGNSGQRNGAALQARFEGPTNMVFDEVGNLYVVNFNKISKIDKTGNVTTFAGSVRGYKDGPGQQAMFSSPAGIAFDSKGNLYVADSWNHRIRKIDKVGNVSTFAGSGSHGFQDGPGKKATFNYPMGIVIDTKDNLYVADSFHHRVRKIDKTGNVTTVAGTGKAGFQDGPGKKATFKYPDGIAIDAKSNLFVSEDQKQKIRKIAPDGSVTTITLPASCDYKYIVVGHREDLYFPCGRAIYKFYLSGTLPRTNALCVQTFTGTTLSGSGDGSRSIAQLSHPTAVARYDNSLYVVDSFNHKIRKIDKAGNVTTVAGIGVSGFQDGPGSQAMFNYPEGIAIDIQGNLYVTDSLNHRIRKIDKTGNVTTIAGTGKFGFQDGPSPQAMFNYPEGIVIDIHGNLYITETKNHRIRKIDKAGNVTTIAGTGKFGFQDGPGSQAMFGAPEGIAIDIQGNLYVADSLNHRIRKIDRAGNVTTIAGTGKSGFQDGPGSQASFNIPGGIAIDAKGILYVADTWNNKIRKIDKAGNVTTIAGIGLRGFRDGPGSKVKFSHPKGIAIDDKDNLYVADPSNNRIRKLFIRGVVDTRESKRKQGESCDLPDPRKAGHHKCQTGLTCKNNTCIQ